MQALFLRPSLHSHSNSIATAKHMTRCSHLAHIYLRYAARAFAPRVTRCRNIAAKRRRRNRNKHCIRFALPHFHPYASLVYVFFVSTGDKHAQMPACVALYPILRLTGGFTHDQNTTELTVVACHDKPHAG